MQVNKQILAELIRDLSTKGHAPVTSGNYSLRDREDGSKAWISQSGINKSKFTEDNFLLIDIASMKLEEKFKNLKPSDETAIHLELYKLMPNINCIFHSHMMSSLKIAEISKNSLYEITGLELQKAFRGINTHLSKIHFLIIENSQDMNEIIKEIHQKINKTAFIYGIILKGHGIYIWGESIEETLKHLEASDYLFHYCLFKEGLSREH